jgi:peptide/nickel transport system ATP-binding protein
VVHGIGTATQRSAGVRAIMERVGLPHRLAHSYPSQLSGGQRQRVAIARALVVKPDILVCDEPTSALDVSVQAQVLNLLKDLRDQLGLTYIFISHDLSVVEFIADRIAVMYLGRVVECGPAAQVLERPRHPYTEALLRSVLTPVAGASLPDANLGSGAADPLNPPSGCRFHPRCPRGTIECEQAQPPRHGDVDDNVECLHPIFAH